MIWKNININLKDKFELFLIIIIIIGLGMRISTFWLYEPVYIDSTIYSVMGNSFKNEGEFILPYGNIGAKPSMTQEYSHHFAPGYPIYLSLFYSIFGFTMEITKVASIISSFIFIFIVFLTTKSLYDKRSALICTAILAVDYNYINSVALAYSENLVATFFVLTIWAIIKSLKDERYIILAGLFAGIGYLTKSSIGYFFIIAGLCGLLWRFYYMKWGVFKDKYYITAIIVFFSFVGVWSLRNIMRFGFPNWETSYYIPIATSYAFNRPLEFTSAFILKSFFFFCLLLMYAVFWLKPLKETLKKIKDENYSGLWLAVLLPVFLGLIFVTIFYLYEKMPIFWSDNFRYILIVFVPLMWLVLKIAKFDNKIPSINFKNIIHAIRRTKFNLKFIVFCILIMLSIIVFLIMHFHILGIILLMGSFTFMFIKNNKLILCVMIVVFIIADVNLLTSSYYNDCIYEVGKDLDNMIKNGDRLAIKGGTDSIYIFYYFIYDKNITYEIYNDNVTYDYVIDFTMDKNLSNNYTIINIYQQNGYPGVIESLYGNLRLFLFGNFIDKTQGSNAYLTLYKNGINR